MNRLRDRVATQFVAFVCVGAVATGAQYIVLIMLVQAFNVWPIVASDIGLVLGAVINYALNRRFTFASCEPHLKAIPRFAAVAGAGLLLNSLVVVVLMAARAHYLIAQVVATGAVLIWNFVLNRTWTFRASSNPQRKTIPQTVAKT